MKTANDGYVATEQQDGAGVLTYWRLSGTASVEDVAEAWADEGVSLVAPEAPTDHLALRRATMELHERRRLVRPLGRREGFAVVEERALREVAFGEGGAEVEGPETLSYSVELKTGLAANGQLTIEPETHPDAQTITTAFSRHRRTLATTDIGSWLVRAVSKLDGVAMRDSGGFYYLPPKALPQWEGVCKALSFCSGHRVFRIPVMRTQEAVEAILDGVLSEATQEAARVESDLSEGLGVRAIQARKGEINALRSKVSRYEELLGASLSKLTERLDTLHAGILAAELAAEREAASKKAAS